MLVSMRLQRVKKTITPKEFVSNVAEVPSKVGNWLTNEVEKTKEIPNKSWAKQRRFC